MSTTSGRNSRADASARVPVSASRDHLDVVLRIQQRGETGPHQGLVVGDEHTNRHVPELLSFGQRKSGPQR